VAVQRTSSRGQKRRLNAASISKAFVKKHGGNVVQDCYLGTDPTGTVARPNFYGVVATLLQSSVQGIKLQSNMGIALGMFLKNTNRVRFSVLGGLGWQRSNYVQSSTTQNPQDIGVAIFSSNLEAFRFKKTRLELNGSVVPALTDPGRIFSKTNLSYYFKMFGKVDWNLSFYGNWDTRPPPHFEGVDYGSSTGLSWTFGNK
jgi:hypothetical protein